MIGQLTTLERSGGGNLWNVFRNSGIVGFPQIISFREHRLSIAISSTHEHGVELDNVTISFSQCNGECPSIALPMQQQPVN